VQLTSAGAKVAETSRDPSAVTSVIRHTVRARSENRYEAWFREVTAIAQTFTGHRGVDFIRPPKGSRTYTVVLRFDTSEHLKRWLSSDARKRLIAEIEPYLKGGDQVEVRTGLEFWFTPPDSEQHAKTYKQFLIAWSVIFPLTIFVPWVLHPLFQTVPFLGLPGINSLLISAIIVGLMTYVIMPRYTRMAATWLYR
jgi:antibiotic biosynthesis monooxygenase (ABM) superfamily enzyme